MKKLLIIALLATTIATSAFATDANKISFTIKNNFQREYAQAEKVIWTLRPTFAKATFVYDGKTMEAFYTLGGESIGTSQVISIDELPTNAKRNFAKKYSGYDVKEAIEFNGVDEHAYFISAENEKEKVVLKVDAFNSVSVFKKEKKN